MLQLNYSNSVKNAKTRAAGVPKKYKSSVLTLILAALLVVTVTGCAEYTKQVAYGHGLYELKPGSIYDQAKIENHIATLGLPVSPLIYEGKGKSEEAAMKSAKAEAQKAADEMLAKFKRSDFEALGLDPTTSFVWGVMDEEGYICKFEWNVKKDDAQR